MCNKLGHPWACLGVLGSIACSKRQQRSRHRGVLGVCRADGKNVVVAQRQRQVAQHQRQLAHGLIIAEEEVLAQRCPAQVRSVRASWRMGTRRTAHSV